MTESINKEALIRAFILVMAELYPTTPYVLILDHDEVIGNCCPVCAKETIERFIADSQMGHLELQEGEKIN